MGHPRSYSGTTIPRHLSTSYGGTMLGAHFGRRTKIATLRNVLTFAAICLLPVFALAQTRASAGPGHQEDWRARLNQQLQLMGHRNWIAVVDSAYPLQTSAGVETIETNDDQLQVVKIVLDQI